MRTAVKYGVAEDFISMVLDGSDFHQYCTPTALRCFSGCFAKKKKITKTADSIENSVFLQPKK